jgi:aminoglycoside phosphotransferase (APT) family kinase protein
MALVNRRMFEVVRQAILPWLRERSPGADEIILPTPRRPDAGGSSDTFFLDPLIREHGKERREYWVLRIEATEFQVYQDPSVERQYEVMTLLAQHSDVPVPRTFSRPPVGAHRQLAFTSALARTFLPSSRTLQPPYSTMWD